MDFKKQFALGLALATIFMECAMWYPVLFHRKHRLIRVRGLASMFTTAGMWSLTTIVWNLAVALDWSCLATSIVTQYMHVTVGFFFFEKFCMILINFSINQEAVNYVNAIQQSMDPHKRNASLTAKPANHKRSPFSSGWSKWIFDHRMYFTAQWNSPSKLFTGGLVLAYSSVAAIVFSFTTNDPHAPFGSEACYDVLMMWWRSALISGGFACFLVLISAYRFIKVKESFFLKQELFLYCFVGVLALVVFTYRSFASKSMLIYYDQKIHLYGLVLLFIGAVGNKLIWGFVLNKVRLEAPKARMCADAPGSTEKRPSSREFESPTTPREKPLETFKKLLLDDDERNRFRDFLITEFAVENLLFWEEVEFLLRLQVAEEKCAKVMQIYDEFCSEHSKLTVNLSSLQFDAIKAIVNRLNDPSCDKEAVAKDLGEPMQRAQHEIVLLMLQDSYPRYKRYLKGRALHSQGSFTSNGSFRSPNSPTSGGNFGTSTTPKIGASHTPREGFPVQELQI